VNLPVLKSGSQYSCKIPHIVPLHTIKTSQLQTFLMTTEDL